MPWIIGIDEAGYGPNLGPFVMTSVACHVPRKLARADLWQVLADAVRRHGDPDDGRLLIEDSKLVHSGPNAFRDLERNVLAALNLAQLGESPTLIDYLTWASPGARADLAAECWFRGDSPLPVVAQRTSLHETAERFASTCQRGKVVWGLVRSQVLCPGHFNTLLDRWDSKGAVLSSSLVELVQCNCRHVLDDEPMAFVVDKHGGRNHYAAVLQHALPEGMVLAHEEGPDLSLYSVVGLPRQLRLTFTPRADATHLCVALASMFSKYLRELLMLEFNRFWKTHLPDLKATAGYPGDSARYYESIKPVAERLGVPEAALWRRK